MHSLSSSLDKPDCSLPKSIDVILKGRVSNNKIYSFYHLESPNLFINLSSSEGVPVSIMEAMSFGTAVVATNVGGSSEIVSNSNGQLLIENPSEQEIANAINRHLNLTKKEKEKCSKSAYDTWSNNYNADENYTEFSSEIATL